jgi:hypothetical protein
MKYQAQFITHLDDGQELQVTCKQENGKPVFTIAACQVTDDREDTCLVLKGLSLKYVKEFARQLNTVIQFSESE